MWEKIRVKSYNPFTNKPEEFLVEGINKNGLIISRAAEFAVVVEKQIIRNLIVEHIQRLQREGIITNFENQLNIATLDYLSFLPIKIEKFYFYIP
jgi:hypothetical protein